MLFLLLSIFVLVKSDDTIFMDNGVCYGPYEIETWRIDYFDYFRKEYKDQPIMFVSDAWAGYPQFYASCTNKQPSKEDHQWSSDSVDDESDSHLRTWLMINPNQLGDDCPVIYLAFDFSDDEKSAPPPNYPEYYVNAVTPNTTIELKLNANDIGARVFATDYYHYIHDDNPLNVSLDYRSFNIDDDEATVYVGRAYKPTPQHYDYVDYGMREGQIVVPMGMEEEIYIAVIQNTLLGKVTDYTMAAYYGEDGNRRKRRN